LRSLRNSQVPQRIGHWLLAIGYWLLAIGYLRLSLCHAGYFVVSPHS
jgi:hypothetical protein